jgi:hypothetical protein
MTTQLEELESDLVALEADVGFVSLATRLRPRIGDVIQWDSKTEVIKLAQSFMNAKESRPEGVYGPLLIRLLGSFERYIRKLVDFVLTERSAGVADYSQLPHSLSRRNIRLTGRALANIDEPRDHLVLDVGSLIDKLASCKPGRSDFKLNSQAFTSPIVGSGPGVLEKALASVDIDDWWDAVGRNDALIRILGTKGARQTGDRSRERLRELSKWRNQLAHGADEELAVSETQLRDAIDFIRVFTASLDSVIRKRTKHPRAA